MTFDEIKPTEVREKPPLTQRLKKAWQLSHFLRQLSIRNFFILFSLLTVLVAANYKWIARDWNDAKEWNEKEEREQFWKDYRSYIYDKTEEDGKVISAMFLDDIFDDSVMKRLGKQDLRCVDIRSRSITNDGLKELVPMQNLEVLKVMGNRLTGRPVGGPKLDDGCFTIIKLFPKLRDLYLWDAKITNKGLEELAKNQSLERIEFRSCTLIDDAGLVHFGRMESLKLLSLHGCGLSDGAEEKLRKIVPGVELILSSNPGYKGRYFVEREFE